MLFGQILELASQRNDNLQSIKSIFSKKCPYLADSLPIDCHYLTYLLIACHWPGLDPPPLRGADRNLALSPERSAFIDSGSALLRVGARKGIRSMDINQTAIITRYRLTSGNHSNACGKEGVVLYGFS